MHPVEVGGEHGLLLKHHLAESPLEEPSHVVPGIRAQPLPDGGGNRRVALSLQSFGPAGLNLHQLERDLARAREILGDVTQNAQRLVERLLPAEGDPLVQPPRQVVRSDRSRSPE